MATLWTFGDSLTAPFEKKYIWSEKYIEWKGYVPEVYGEIISKKLNLNLINKGVGGNDNYSIFQEFCDVSNKIKENDIVIFGWSSPLRFRLATNDNKWKTFLPHYKKNRTDITNISITTIEEIIVNRESVKFSEEVNSWIKLIDGYLKDISHVHWTTFDDRLNVKMINNLENIRTETKGLIDDGHFSEKGQNELSDILITSLSKGNTKKII